MTIDQHLERDTVVRWHIVLSNNARNTPGQAPSLDDKCPAFFYVIHYTTCSTWGFTSHSRQSNIGKVSCLRTQVSILGLKLTLCWSEHQSLSQVHLTARPQAVILPRNCSKTGWIKHFCEAPGTPTHTQCAHIYGKIVTLDLWPHKWFSSKVGSILFPISHQPIITKQTCQYTMYLFKIILFFLGRYWWMCHGA